MKNTKNKNEILTFLMQHRDAYTPYEIAKSLKINAVTVYRVLESLKKEKVVHHIISLGKWSACQCHDIRKDHGFLICRKCESIQEFLAPHLGLHHHGFKCEEYMTEIFGVCQKCAKKI